MFTRIAVYFGGMPQGDRWHVDLLNDMALEIPEVRPRVVSDEVVDDLMGLLRFRHVVRHLYAFALRRDEMQRHLDRLAETHRRLEADCAVFEAYLTALARSV